MEGSFADAANNHGLKRSRWRGLWKQIIQDLLIATCQNLRKLGTALLALWRTRSSAVHSLALALAAVAHLLDLSSPTLKLNPAKP
jgi:hypothetical protein